MANKDVLKNIYSEKFFTNIRMEMLEKIDKRITDITREIGEVVIKTINHQGIELNSERKKDLDDIINGVISVKSQLEKLVKLQANIYYALRKGGDDDDNYHDAKRYITYLLIEKILKKCYPNSEIDNCYIFVDKDLIDYFNSLTLEEYIRIKAFFKWVKANNYNPTTDISIDRNYYFEALNEIDNIKINCKRKQVFSGKVVNHLSTDIKKYLTEKKLKKIIKGKRYTIKRLQLRKPDEINAILDMKEFMRNFYNSLKNAILHDIKPNKESVTKVVEIFYKNTHIPNMLEYLFKCYFCSFLSNEEHESLRKKYGKKPLEN